MTETKKITAITINHRLSSKEVRRRLKDDNMDRCECFVCGGYKPITESHHIIHVKELAHAMRNGFIKPPLSVPVVWLCPNHHKIIHLLDLKKDKAFALLSKAEILAANELYEARRLWWEKLYEGIRNGN